MGIPKIKSSFGNIPIYSKLQNSPDIPAEFFIWYVHLDIVFLYFLSLIIPQFPILRGSFVDKVEFRADCNLTNS